MDHNTLPKLSLHLLQEQMSQTDMAGHSERVYDMIRAEAFALLTAAASVGVTLPRDGALDTITAAGTIRQLPTMVSDPEAAEAVNSLLIQLSTAANTLNMTAASHYWGNVTEAVLDGSNPDEDQHIRDAIDYARPSAGFVPAPIQKLILDLTMVVKVGESAGVNVEAQRVVRDVLQSGYDSYIPPLVFTADDVGTYGNFGEVISSARRFFSEALRQFNRAEGLDLRPGSF